MSELTNQFPATLATIRQGLAGSPLIENIARLPLLLCLCVLTMSLHTGARANDSEQAAADPAAFSKANPQLLQWKDRRPIGRIFLSKVISGWEKNPRGYLSDKDLDVTTPEGRAEFGQKLLAYADRCVEILKKSDAQGVIVWDIEGQEAAHPISYLGDPRVLPQIPEMDEHADAFFKKFTAAGIPVGICIRPSRVSYTPATRWRWSHETLDDPGAEMADKIAYAKKRWNCTIFYIDSNTHRQTRLPGDGPLPASLFRMLKEKYPDVLLIPEWETLAYWAVSAPYKDWWDGRRTPALAATVWPGAFSCITAPERDLAKEWDSITLQVSRGDVLFVDGWIDSDRNGMVQHAYQAADFLKAGVPAKVTDAGSNSARLLDACGDADLRTRYFALAALAKNPTAAAAPEVGPCMMELLKDPQWLVRKGAVDVLGTAKHNPAIAPLIDIMSGSEGLNYFAAAALAKIGPPALEPLIATLNGKNRIGSTWAVEALAMSGNKDAVPALLPMVANPLVMRALGELRDQRAVPALVKILQEPTPATQSIPQIVASRARRSTAAEALGKIGGPDAIAALKEATNDSNKGVAQKAAAALKEAQQGPQQPVNPDEFLE